MQSCGANKIFCVHFGFRVIAYHVCIFTSRALEFHAPSFFGLFLTLWLMVKVSVCGGGTYRARKGGPRAQAALLMNQTLD